MISIGDWIDKLVVENMKLFTVRDKLNTVKKNSHAYTVLYDTMMKMTDNRAKIMNALDKKVADVISGREPNIFIERIRTYNMKEME